MADNPPPTDDAAVEGKFKKWINEVLDERKAKDTTPPDPPTPTDDKTRTNPPATIFESLFGKK